VFIYSPSISSFLTHLHKYNLSSPPTLRTRGHRFSVTSAVAAESGQYLFTSGKEGNIIKWDIPSGRRLATFYKMKPSPSSDNSQSKGKGKAKVLDTAASDVKGHSNEVLSLALSSDGKYLVSGGRDRRLVVWDAEKGEWIKTFQGPMNHKDAISVGLSLIFFPFIFQF
jgi:ribosomal RNA-processing protein 9